MATSIPQRIVHRRSPSPGRRRDTPVYSVFLRYLVLLVFSGMSGAVMAQDTGLPTVTDQLAEQNRNSLGPFKLSNADGSSSIRFQFAGQLRTVCASRDPGMEKERKTQTMMGARRIRLALTGTILHPTLSYRLHLSTAPGSAELMDFYFNYRIADGAQVRYGQYKVPFTNYRIQSFQRLTFVDWAIVSEYFGAERQMGVSLHNGYEKPAAFSYVVGLFTGENARASHAVGLAEVYGAEITSPSALTNPGIKAEFHPELFLHVARRAHGIQIQSESDQQKGGFRYSAGFSAAWDLAPVNNRDFTIRLAPELLVKYRGLSAAIIGYAGFCRLGVPAHRKLAMRGGLLQAACGISHITEVSARYAIVEVRDALIDAIIDRIGSAPAEPFHRRQEMTVGCNIYIVGHSVKWQHDATWLCNTLTGESRDDFTVRSQFQVAF